MMHDGTYSYFYHTQPIEIYILIVIVFTVKPNNDLLWPKNNYITKIYMCFMEEQSTYNFVIILLEIK